MSATKYVIWSEEHGRWWLGSKNGYTDSLLKAGRFSEEEAKSIELRGNRYARQLHEVALPDPVRIRHRRAPTGIK